MAICLSLFVPWALFTVVFSLLSFSWRYSSPGMCWFSVFGCLFIILTIGFFAYTAVKKRQAGEAGREPTWFVFVFVTSLFGWILAVALGLVNYSANTYSFYAMASLHMYPGIDPSSTFGQAVLDAGQIAFLPGSWVDTSKAVGFKNGDVYCAAPVTKGDVALTNYDFWIVGRNCCSGEPGDFHCSGGRRYLGGLRVQDETALPFYRLATQQAAAYHHFGVGPHPIFVEHYEDPIGHMLAQEGEGLKNYFFWVSLFFALMLFLVTVVVVLFSRHLS